MLPYNDQRLPGFYRLDFRIEKSWPFGKKGHISVVLEGLNVTLQREATQATCTETGSFTPDTCSPYYVGPISIPSLGVEGSL